jgi:hypothetical protein
VSYPVKIVIPDDDLHAILQQDNLSFPLICPDWNADEEILLLEVLLCLFGTFTS